MFFTKLPQSIFLKPVGDGKFTCMHTDTISKAGDYDRMQENRRWWRKTVGIFSAFVGYIFIAYSVAQLLQRL